jgi:uncharacterized protein (DUF1501 family)
MCSIKGLVMNTRPTTSRRKFLKQTNCAAVGTASLFSTLFTLRMTAGAASGEPLSGYKALVCLFLSGGNDSFNMLAPKDATAYSEYAAVRTTLALPQGDLLPITSAGQPYSDFGIHHHLPFLQTLYNQNHLAFVSNVGTLIEPTTLAQYQAKSSPLPVGLFSHADEQVHWQTMVPQIRGAGPKGWAGRMADCMTQANLNGSVGMNISLSGNNVLQAGHTSIPYTTDPAGAVLLAEYQDPALTNAVDSIYAQQYKNLYQKTLASSNRRAIDTAVAFDAAVGGLSTTQAFANDQEKVAGEWMYNGKQTSLDKRLQMISKVMTARTTLGMNRQIFFVNRGGWDHHNEVILPQEDLFNEVNDAIADFWAELGHMGLQNDVVLFTVSDFGRTLTSNGLGSDHAWGGNAFMLGGPVNGGQIYGQYPVLATGGPLDIGRGRLLPTTSVDQYSAELASWFDVPKTELSTVFPNCGNFFNPMDTPYPLGILSP